jgi:hypothetical protein
LYLAALASFEEKKISNILQNEYVVFAESVAKWGKGWFDRLTMSGGF